jgi:hypothetical protein
VAEGFHYQALGLELRLPAGARGAIEGSATLAFLQNDPLRRLPESLGGANVTSASADFITLDSAFRLELTSGDGGWVLVPGLFYHHQWAYIAGGLDLEIRRVLAGGDSVLRASYGGRLAQLNQRHWDGSGSTFDNRLSSNFLLSFTQTISPSLVAAASLQYTRQGGLLHSTLKFVAVYDAGGAPVLLTDEVLPGTRDRWQLNLRGRYSPRLGRSFGLDLSAYRDDWGIREAAVEPSLETPVPMGGARARAWYRVAVQQASRYFEERPRAVLPYATQDPSLGSFVLQSAGVLLLIPLRSAGRASWVLRVTVLGFHRSDRIQALGGSAGVAAEW